MPKSGHSKGNEALIRRISASFKNDRRGSFITTNAVDANSVRFIQDRMDDLDVRIASREFEEAVRSIEKGISVEGALTQGRQLLGTIDPKQQTYLLLSIHLSHRTQQLTNILSHCLSLESRLPKSTKRYASLLFRLGEDDLAKSTYLQSRSEYVGRKIRAMQHPGAYGVNDVDGTVEGIAWLVVRVIKNSWSVYSETFTDTRMASSFFEWVKEQVEGKRNVDQFLIARVCRFIPTSAVWISSGFTGLPTE
jgi:hypothetical protein